MLSTFETRKSALAAIRTRARALYESGTPGIQIASVICTDSEALLMRFADEIMDEMGLDRAALARQGAVLAVGGTGRGELCPCSDVDLLFLTQQRGCDQFRQFTSRFVQCCWDAGFTLGHAVRDLSESISLAQQDAQIATSLVEARLLWGSESLYAALTSQFWRRVIQSRRRQFIEQCLAARSEHWSEFGPTAQELQPDVKSSVGGLRDVHLIRWIGYARYQVKEIDGLRLKGALSKKDARTIRQTWEFLTRLRIDLHLEAGKAQDILTRDEQLRITEARGYTQQGDQRPVEQFMRDYFRHTSALAVITRRFVAMHRPRSLFSQTKDLIVSHRAEGVLSVSPDRIDVAPRNLAKVCENLESILRFYKSCALYGIPPAPRVSEAIRSAAASLPNDLSPAAAAQFMDILEVTRPLGMILRAMFDTGVLDLVIPDFAHVRSLMQFNQYHHFTVDEHTIRAVEAATAFEHDDSPIGTAYRVIKHRRILHLALLLHDVGKGFDRDHSEVGAEIAERIADRLRLSSHHREQLAALVLKHLVMADVAFRRDITDEQMLFSFSHEIGSPDTLRMLYVLTAADITAVGPGTWSSWKASLLTDLFDRCLVILSGKRYAHHEQQRLATIKREVEQRLVQRGVKFPDLESRHWLDAQLAGFSAYYLTCTPPEQIASDVQLIQGLGPDDIEVVGHWDEPTDTTEYRVITRSEAASTGCFHKMAGVLTAKHLSILSADINTTATGVIVDSYRVEDGDYDGKPPDDRIAEVAEALRSVLRGDTTVQKLFRQHRRYGAHQNHQAVSNLTTRVRIDTESSDSRIIIDVFAHDRPGLLYTVSRALFDLGLSVDLAKIATHFDQVVDVFYVREANGKRVDGEQRLKHIRTTLEERLHEFESGGYAEF